MKRLDRETRSWNFSDDLNGFLNSAFIIVFKSENDLKKHKALIMRGQQKLIITSKSFHKHSKSLPLRS